MYIPCSQYTLTTGYSTYISGPFLGKSFLFWGSIISLFIGYAHILSLQLIHTQETCLQLRAYTVVEGLFPIRPLLVQVSLWIPNPHR
jgi:hypothetical protein